MSGAEISQEVVERMVVFVRRMADPNGERCGSTAEARAIVALLPEPVDPDLVAGREMLAKFYEADNERRGNEHYYSSMIADVRAGLKDDTPPVLFAVHALKQSRELAAKP